ncbi:MAG: hypothetical protein KJP07_21730, partial [Desulfatitalea sp.]|nr:hypothetical protein [Desulfatitalea sp.]
ATCPVYLEDFLQTHLARARPDALVGLGRTIYPMIDRHQLQHALDDVTEKRKRGNDDITAHFVARGGRNELLRTEVVPVLDHEEAFAGFILMFRDITRHLRTAGQVAGTMTDLARAVRTTSASIRASIEAIMEYPEMDREQLDRFREIIYNESVILGAITDQIDNDNCARRDTEWPLMPIRSNDLTAYLQRTAAEKLDLTIDVLDGQRTFDIRVDKYALTLALLFVMDQIRQTDGTDHFICRVDQKADFVHIDFSWTGQALKVETLHQWDRMWLQIAGADLPFTLKQMLRYHGAEICPVTLSTATPSSGMRIFLPSCKPFAQPPQLRTVAIMPQSRPEFFDFDLFERDEPHPEVAQRPLLELQYTVFDTETTGLDPGGGDEILSIGAIRIVNGRLLHSECFDHLIDPRRTIPSASIRIHGIDSEMVAGHPDINTVLPKFHRFAANTILVAHNAAFDMRLLQVKEKSTGIQFSHPVLDTLLLSAVVHPAQSDHTLEAIADRMGVPIQGRHSAMGDAVVTGRIFVKMIPLLAEKGITTLSEAITASRKTVYARITY